MVWISGIAGAAGLELQSLIELSSSLFSVVTGAVLRSQDLKVQHAWVVGLASVRCLLEVVGLIDAQGTDTLSAYDMW